MTIHDRRRREALIKTLQKASEQAEIALLYLTVNNQDSEEIAKTSVVREHIDIALEHLNSNNQKTREEKNGESTINR